MGKGEIERLASERLGFERLRPGQLPAVEALVDGRDVLAVLPTGAGKSAIYELAGLLRAGPTVVLSPLIALEDDQLAHLRSAGLHAILLNSRQSAGKRAAALLASCQPDSFVFLSPEQLANSETRQTSAARRAWPVRRGRGAPDQSVGPRLPARLHDARRAGRGDRRAGPPGADRYRGAAGAPGDHHGGSACASHGSSSATSTGRTSTCRFAGRSPSARSSSTSRAR